MKYKKAASLTSFLTIRPQDASGDIYFAESLDDAARFTVEHHSFFLLGGGSNVIAGRVRRPILSLRFLVGESVTREEGDRVSVSMPAWTPVNELIAYLVENGLSGLEFMAGIPGTVGGAVVGNAAPKGYSWEGYVRSVTYLKEGSILIATPRFAYRKIVGLPEKAYVVLFVELVLRKETPAKVRARVRDFLSRRLTIPYPSAGSLFKNPEGISAGKLLDEAGCRGLAVGDAALYEEHANIVVNRGNACYADFVALRDEAVERVYGVCGVRLEPEVKFWS